MRQLFRNTDVRSSCSDGLPRPIADRPVLERTPRGAAIREFNEASGKLGCDEDEKVWKEPCDELRNKSRQMRILIK